MIKATDLGGRAVVDMDAAEKLGSVHKVILDPDGRRVAGFVVARGGSLFNAGAETTLSATAVHAIGPDAITVRSRPITDAEADRLERLPRVSDLVGRKVVSQDGQLLGTVDDVLIEPTDGRIIGYALEGGNRLGKLENLLGGDKGDQRPAYIRADAELRAGQDLIIAPADAVHHEGAADTRVAAPAPVPVSAPLHEPTSGWATWPGSTTDASVWIRGDAAVPKAEPRRGDDDGLLHRER
jgi:uncharacterized protein YrrD